MSNKKQQIINTALQLFYRHGVNSIGINEILKISGVAKKTLYHHFSSKEALVISTLMARDQIFLAWLDARLLDRQTDQEVVHRLFDALTDWFHDRVEELGTFRGCFFINTAAEVSDPESHVSHYCRQHKQQVRALIQKHLRSKQKSLLELICLLKEGAIVSAYVNQDLDAAQKCIPWLDRYMADG